MEAFQERMVAELKELYEREEKLNNFINSSKFDTLEKPIQKHIMAQMCGMEIYSTALINRLLSYGIKVK